MDWHCHRHHGYGRGSPVSSQRSRRKLWPEQVACQLCPMWGAFTGRTRGSARMWSAPETNLGKAETGIREISKPKIISIIAHGCPTTILRREYAPIPAPSVKGVSSSRARPDIGHRPHRPNHREHHTPQTQSYWHIWQ